MARWPTLVPLGNLVVSAAGSTVLLSSNCGPLAGQISGPNYLNPPVPGTPLRQIILTNTAAAGGAVAYLLPRGNTAAANPGNILMAIIPQQTVAIPNGMPFENGILPENLCVDGSAAVTVYGCGVIS